LDAILLKINTIQVQKWQNNSQTRSE